METWIIVSGGLVAFLGLVFLYDVVQKRNPILRNFPIVGHLRFFLIEIGPEIRQYLVASNREEAPFNRSEREWIHRSADKHNNYFGFGTDDQIYGIGYPIIKHAMFPASAASYTGSKADAAVQIPCAKVMGSARGRRFPYRPSSVLNISAMSYGSMGSNAISALNKGAKAANCFHNTGEGGCSKFHRYGADICYQIGTGYFGCRDAEGRFSVDALKQTVDEVPEIKCIEIKLSQGAKPGKGGVLPGAKVTKLIAEARGVPVGQDCISPNSHCEFNDVEGLVDFVETIADVTGRPVGIKSAIGQLEFWYALAEKMAATGSGPDFVTIDGGEGGTGAAPLAFADHVALPYKLGFQRVYKIFQDHDLCDDIVWIGSGKLGFSDRAIVAIAMGADLINIAREAMLAIGCIQAQKCHIGKCPAGVTTHNEWLQRGLDPDINAERLHNYVQAFRNELAAITHAAGYEHVGQFTPHDVELSAGPGIFVTLRELNGYDKKQYAPDKEPCWKAPARGGATIGTKGD
jgi:glutamate synthase (ferredoxin)